MSSTFDPTTLARFRTSTSGNIAVIFAIALLPILTAMGCAVDYSQANAAYAKLQACADTAAVAAVSKEGMTKTASEAQVSMVKWFNAVCPAPGPNLSNVTVSDVSATASDNGGARVAAVAFKASRTNDFLGVAGLPHTDIRGSAKAGSAQPTYIDIYSLMDDSPSMGLGATAADQSKLMSLTGGCQFGCHVTGSTAAAPDNYTIAKTHSVQMRIDVLRNSWLNLINQADKTAGAGTFRFATYTFDKSLNVEQPLTGSAATALASAGNIDLVAVDSGGPGSTYADNALQSMVANIPSAGDGSSPANSKKYLIFVTDGVQDFFNCGAIDCHQTSILTSSSCNALKNKGISVAVVYTTYLPMNNIPYNALVQPLASSIAPALQSCATSGLYFEATDAKDISGAFNKIFANIAYGARLTN